MAARKTKPEGKKPDKLLRHALLLALNREQADPVTGKLTKRSVIIAEKVAQLACEGDMQAIKEVWDRTEGKATQQVDLRRIGSIADLHEDELEALARSGKDD